MKQTTIEEVTSIVSRFCKELGGTYYLLNQIKYTADIIASIDIECSEVVIKLEWDNVNTYPIFTFKFYQLKNLEQFFESITQPNKTNQTL